jgi:flagellar hook-basal body complex protein FliE
LTSECIESEEFDMSENEFYKIDKLMPYKTKTGRTYIQDGNLQINSPHMKEGSKAENANAFNRLLSYYTKEIAPEHMHVANQNAIERETLRIAMQDAEQTFNSMMEISKQLRAATQEIMQMQ